MCALHTFVRLNAPFATSRAAQVRSMYLLLPQLVAQDQPGVGDAVAEHFATAHTWERVLHARVRLLLYSARWNCATDALGCAAAGWSS